MAEGRINLEESQRTILMCAIQSLEDNAESVKFELNIQVDKLIETVNRQRENFLNKIDSELAKAKEPLKMHENRILAQLENAKKLLARELEGNEDLIAKLTENIDNEMKSINFELPIFKFQWKPSFTKLCDRIEEVGDLHIYTKSRFEKFPTPLWTSRLCCGKGDNDLSEAKSLAIDPETSNIYVGDPSAAKILVLDRLGDYLGSLKLKKPSSIGRMVICQDSIYCKVNSYLANTLYRLDKRTGELLGKFDCGNIASITAQPDMVFLCDYGCKLNILSPDLSNCEEVPLESPFIKRGLISFSIISALECVKDELITLVYNSMGSPIQVFSKAGTLLRAIAADFPLSFTEAYLCIDEHCNIIISVDGSKMVSVYSKDGNNIANINALGDDRDEVSRPKGIALDKDGNLVMCNNRYRDILQAF